MTTAHVVTPAQLRKLLKQAQALQAAITMRITYDVTELDMLRARGFAEDAEHALRLALEKAEER